MLKIQIPKQELYNELANEFIYVESTLLRLEHSLEAIREWESKWHKPFLGDYDKTTEETMDYIRCMDLNKDRDPKIYKYLSEENVYSIVKYIKDPMTATTFGRLTNNPSVNNDRRPITAEIIYYWMIDLGIPVEFEKWHINQLLTLIQVVSIKRSPKKKVNKNELARQRAEENARRRAKYNTRG